MHIQLSKVQGLNVIQEKMTIFNHLSTLDYFNFIFLIFCANQTCSYRYFEQLLIFLCLEKHISKFFYDLVYSGM